MSGVSELEVEGYLVVALFGLFLLRRTYRMTQGVPAGAFRLAVLPAVYLGLYVFELTGIWIAGAGSGHSDLTLLTFGADAALVAGGTGIAYRITSRHVELYRPTGEVAWFYRLKPLLPVLYVVLFTARVAIETVVVGISPFALPTAAQFNSISPTALDALFVVDALWGLTTGFLIGRSAAVYRAWRRAEKSPAADAPLAD
jgi:hypothetical protein